MQRWPSAESRELFGSRTQKYGGWTYTHLPCPGTSSSERILNHRCFGGQDPIPIIVVFAVVNPDTHLPTMLPYAFFLSFCSLLGSLRHRPDGTKLILGGAARETPPRTLMVIIWRASGERPRLCGVVVTDQLVKTILKSGNCKIGFDTLQGHFG